MARVFPVFHPHLIFIGFGLAWIMTSLGCAATQIALEKKDLKIETKMSATVFLDVENQVERTVFLDIRNTTDKEFDLLERVRQRLEGKGYTIVSNPRDAFYILQANVLYVGEADPSALRAAVGGGWGAPLAGAATGALIGAASSARGAAIGAGVGALAFGVGEMVAGALVKDVTFAVVTDLQISEKTPETVEQRVESNLAQGTGSNVVQRSTSTRNRRKYQTRIASSANQVNLTWEEAEGPLLDRLAKSIAGIF